MAKIELGDLFQLASVPKNVFLQFVFADDRLGELVRIFSEGDNIEDIDFERLVNKPEEFVVFFPLKAAARNHVVSKLGNFSIPSSFSRPRLMRSRHVVQGEFRGWHIVDVDTWERELVTVLTADQKKLSPWGVWNDTLLIERLTQGWSLERWM